MGIRHAFTYLLLVTSPLVPSILLSRPSHPKRAGKMGTPTRGQSYPGKVGQSVYFRGGLAVWANKVVSNHGPYMAMVQYQWHHFGIGAPPILEPI